MSHFFKTNSCGFLRKRSGIILAFTSCCGVCSGFLTADIAGAIFPSLVYTASSSCVSTVGLVFAALLPFLLAAAAVHFLNLWYLLPVCFLKCFSYCFVLRGVFLAFPDAGWLAALLLLFTDHISVLLLHCLCFQFFDAEGTQSIGRLSVYIVLLLITVIIDVLIVSPFYTSLF